MLRLIGPKIRSSSGVVADDDREPIATLFEGFVEILDLAGKCQRTAASEVATKTQAWIATYISLGWKITPYVHILHVHLPMSVMLHGGQDRFSGELVELKNDALKKTHLRRTNRRNPKLTLQTQLRLELQEMHMEVKVFNFVTCIASW